MADITVVLPKEDATKSYEVSAKVTPVAVSTAATIKDAFTNKENTLVLIVNASAGATLTIKAGTDAKGAPVHPNAILGDSVITFAEAGDYVVRLQDKSRYQKRDGSIDLASTGTVTVIATAKRAGYMSAEDANAEDTRLGRTLYMDDTRYPVA